MVATILKDEQFVYVYCVCVYCVCVYCVYVYCLHRRTKGCLDDGFRFKEQRKLARLWVV